MSQETELFWNDPLQILQSASDAIIVTDTEFRIRFWNRVAEELFGWSAEAALGRQISDVFDEPRYLDGTSSDEAMFQLWQEGSWTREAICTHRDGSELLVEVSARLFRDADGMILGVIMLGRDIRERKRQEEERTRLLARAEAARAEAEAARRRVEVLADTSRFFAASLDLDEILTAIARRTAEVLRDGCAIRLLSDDGDMLLPGFSYHLDPEARKQLQAMLAAAPQRLGEGLNGRVAQTGQPLLIPHIVPDQIRPLVKPEYWPYVERFGVHSIIVVPLRTGGRIVGALTSIRDQTPDAYSLDDQTFLQDLADRAAQAIEKAFLFRKAHEELAERKRIEAALRSSEQRFRATFNQAAVGIAHVALDGRWQMVNERLCEIVGYTREELLERTFQDITHPADLDADLAYVEQVLSGVIETYTMEKRYIRKDSTLAWVSLTVSLVRTATDEPDYFITIVTDISQRKALEAQLMQAQRMESIGRLAGGVAHDFNNLLTAIRGYAGLIKEALPADTPVQSDLGEIQLAVDRAATLIRQLLAFARQQIMEPRVLDLNELLLNMDRLLQRLIGEDIILRTITAPDLGRVRADPGQIEQVLVNLVINARDAMPEGGELTIETANVFLDRDYVREHVGATTGAHVMLAVSDTGTGMTPEVRAQAFDPFFSTKGPGRGTGLGLATCYGIVKQHGGTIWLYSEPGQGTTVKIYLPLVEADIAGLPPPRNADATAGGNETILLVEDETTVRDLTARLLRNQGYTVLEASNGVEALQLARERHPAPIDLLLADVVMPQMGGPTLAREITGLYPAIKTLFMSGYTANAIVHNGRLDPNVNLLQKPFAAEDLARQIRAVLDG